MLHAHLELPPEKMVYCGMAWGYAAADPINDFRSERPPVAHFTTFL
jgi:hypothetical protein